MTEEASAHLSYISLKATRGTLIADVNHAVKSMCTSMSEERGRKERECVMADGGAEPLRLRAMLYPETRTPNNALLSFPPAAPQQTMLSHLPDLLCVSLAVMMVERSTLQSRSLPGETDPGNGSTINAVSPLHPTINITSNAQRCDRDLWGSVIYTETYKLHIRMRGLIPEQCFIAGELWLKNGCFLV